MTDYFDALETRSDLERAAALAQRLPQQIRHAMQATPWFAQSLAGVDPECIRDRQALARLPVLRKHALLELQQRQRPFGGLAASPFGTLARVFASPGPIYEPEGRRSDYARTARALYAAGIRAGDLVHNSFSYHMSPGGWILEAGAQALGCTVFPAGVGQTELQLDAMRDLQPQAYVGTPSFLRILLARARETGIALPALRRALVSGEAFLPAVRDELAAAGVAACQAYVTAETGLIAYETAAHDGLVVDEGIVLEIVRPGSGEVLPAGEVGEVVVTTFNTDYPLIRFGTGDLSALLPGRSSCGRTNMRIRGWLGRADQSTKVRGMFVHPEQVARLLRDFPQIGKARLVVSNPDASDHLQLHCESALPLDLPRIATALRDITKLRGSVIPCLPGSLPNDGKVIADERKFD